MTHEQLINRLDNEGCYEAIYNDSEGRQIVIVRGLDLYEFVIKLLKKERDACEKICDEIESQAYNTYRKKYESYDEGFAAGALACLEAIRTRGKND